MDRKAAPRRAAALRRTAALHDPDREVLTPLGTGQSNAGPARRLFNEATVTTNVFRPPTELGLANRTQEAIPAQAARLLEGWAAVALRLPGDAH